MRFCGIILFNENCALTKHFLSLTILNIHFYDYWCIYDNKHTISCDWHIKLIILLCSKQFTMVKVFFCGLASHSLISTQIAKSKDMWGISSKSLHMVAKPSWKFELSTLPGRNGMKLGMTFVYMRIITHDDIEKKQLKEIIAHYKTLLKRASKKGKAHKNCNCIKNPRKKRRTEML